MVMICGKLDDLKQYHESILNLVGSFRQKKVELNAFIREAPDALYCLLVKSGNLIGMFRYFRVPKQFINEYKLPPKYESYYQVATVIVDDKYRGKGHGKKLMKYASGLGKIILDTYMSWVPAMHTYLSAGYAILITKKVKDDYMVVFAN